jgi:hypothetical protein
MGIKKTKEVKSSTKKVKSKAASTKKSKVEVKQDTKPTTVVGSIGSPGGPKRRGITKRNATLKAKKRASIPVKRVPKPPKPKYRWGVISVIEMKSELSMDYLIGRYVKILPTSTESRLNCLVQSPGYEGLELPFSLTEITEVPSKPTKERMYNAYLESINKAGISFGVESIDSEEEVDLPKEKTTKKRKTKNEQK